MLRFLGLITLLSYVLCFAGCSGKNTTSSSTDELSLTQALAQLETLPTPEGMGDDQFGALKQSLALALQSSGQTRFTSAAPTGLSGQVADLSLTKQGPTNLNLTWTYRNKGDYDQNKQVTISDLTPLGPNLGKTSAAPDWLSKARAADGDTNNEVNISDITPIGANFFATVTAYKIQSTLTPEIEASWSVVADVPFETSTIPQGSSLRVFEYTLTGTANMWYRVIPYDSESAGMGSNVVQYELSAPDITSVNPTSGDAGTGITFNFTNTGGTPQTISWDFGGGATPDTASTAQPAVTLGAPGTYQASVTATNGAGSDTFDFDLVVNTPAAPVIDDVQPQSGVSGMQVTFVPTLSGGPVATYAWDFGGAGTPNIDNEPQPVVTLGGLGIYPATLTVTNAGGSDVLNFNLAVVPPTNNPPVASFIATPETGDPGDPVQLDASASSDSDGTIAKYEWDLDGDGTYEADGGTDPLHATTLPIPEGTVDVSLRVSDNWNAIDEATLTLSSVPSNPVGPLAVTPPGKVQRMTTLLVVNGNPAIAFIQSDGTQNNVQYIRATTPDGSAWGTLQVVAADTRNFYSLNVINGKPAVTYTSLVDGDNLYYIQSADANGNSWSAPVMTIEDYGDKATKLVQAGDRPGFFYDNSDGMGFMRSDDPDGTSWGAEYALDPDNLHTNQMDAGLVNGNPAIAYHVDRGSNRIVAYVQASNPDGTAWNAPKDVVTSLPVASAVWMCDAGGNPGIVYSTWTETAFVRALDADGANWGSPSTLPFFIQMESYGSLRNLGGIPTITYTHDDDNDLHLLQATDPQGSGWETPLTLQPDVQEYPFAAMVQGAIAVAYTKPDSPNAQLWYYKIN